MNWVGKIIGFPIINDPVALMKFVSEDANHKYVKYVDEHWLDELIHRGCQPTRVERLGDK